MCVSNVAMQRTDGAQCSKQCSDDGNSIYIYDLGVEAKIVRVESHIVTRTHIVDYTLRGQHRAPA